jgi:hypothetical protein
VAEGETKEFFLTDRCIDMNGESIRLAVSGITIAFLAGCAWHNRRTGFRKPALQSWDLLRRSSAAMLRERVTKTTQKQAEDLILLDSSLRSFNQESALSATAQNDGHAVRRSLR